MKTCEQFLEQMNSELKKKLKEFKQDNEQFSFGKIYFTREKLLELIIGEIEKFQAEQNQHKQENN
jgi:putative sterol carrier protein